MSLIVGKLIGPYHQASQPELRESATVPFVEDFLKYYLAPNDSPFSVNSQQPVDSSTMAVDIVVQYYKPNLQPVLHVLCECKRHSARTQRKIDDMEDQLFKYFSSLYLEGSGSTPKGAGNICWGLVATGTKMRAFLARLSTRYGKPDVSVDAIWGPSGECDIKHYKDPHDPKDAADFRKLLDEIKKTGPTTPSTLAGPSAGPSRLGGQPTLAGSQRPFGIALYGTGQSTQPTKPTKEQASSMIWVDQVSTFKDAKGKECYKCVFNDGKGSPHYSFQSAWKELKGGGGVEYLWHEKDNIGIPRSKLSS